jgi:hypothetical protein
MLCCITVMHDMIIGANEAVWFAPQHFSAIVAMPPLRRAFVAGGHLCRWPQET